MAELNPGDVVVICASDDWPEHQFRVDSIHEDCVTGFATTGPLAGEYGEPGLELILRVTEPPNNQT